jgi:hypothetical protein
MRAWIMAAVAAFGIATAVQANEVRFGVYAHDVDILGIGAAGKESGVDVLVAYDFNRLDRGTFLRTPTPYVIASASTSGDTSFAGAGLAWHWAPGGSQRFYVRPELGLVTHDGYANMASPNEVGLSDEEIARRVALRDEHIEFGSKILFQPSISLGWHVSDKTAIELSYVHLSHGQILASGPNEGLDNLGLRLVHKFGE